LISIVVPTLGRPTLKRTLDSIAPGLKDGDEVIVVGDGPQPEARKIAGEFGPRCRYFEHGPTGLWGHDQRNFGISKATGEYLAFMDDDDWYLPRGLEKMRDAIRSDPGKLFLFRIRYVKRVIWKKKVVIPENVCSQIILVPNRPDRLGRWHRGDLPNGRGGDFSFFDETLQLWPEGSLRWIDSYVAKGDCAGHGNATQEGFL